MDLIIQPNGMMKRNADFAAVCKESPENVLCWHRQAEPVARTHAKPNQNEESSKPSSLVLG